MNTDPIDWRIYAALGGVKLIILIRLTDAYTKHSVELS